MDLLQEVTDTGKKSFFGHVFSTTEEGKAEILNVIQYSLLGITPIVILNKTVQRFVPDADPDNSTLEILAEIFIQIIIMFCGVVIIHRMITYFPTYSGFKYESLTLTNVILTFLILVLSIQTKLGLKVNIIVDRILELWNGPDEGGLPVKKRVRFNDSASTSHMTSQADFMDNGSMQSGIFPPAPIATTAKQSSGSGFMGMGRASGSTPQEQYAPGLMAANSVLGGSFGSFF